MSNANTSKAYPRLRNYFLTGLVIVAPLWITIYLTWSFITYIDSLVKPLIPLKYNPDTYLPISVPGFGLLVTIITITLLGFFTANLVGRSIIGYSERILDRMPLVRNLYRGLKQIFTTALANRADLFRQVGLIEYPRKGLWSLVFISLPPSGIIGDELAAVSSGDEMVGVFLPTTPNPTSGYLLFVPRRDIIILAMKVEQAAKLIVSAGIIYSDDEVPASTVREADGKVTPE